MNQDQSHGDERSSWTQKEVAHLENEAVKIGTILLGQAKLFHGWSTQHDDQITEETAEGIGELLEHLGKRLRRAAGWSD